MRRIPEETIAVWREKVADTKDDDLMGGVPRYQSRYTEEESRAWHAVRLLLEERDAEPPEEIIRILAAVAETYPTPGCLCHQEVREGWMCNLHQFALVRLRDLIAERAAS